MREKDKLGSGDKSNLGKMKQAAITNNMRRIE
jgi:hypothetical protein